MSNEKLFAPNSIANLIRDDDTLLDELGFTEEDFKTYQLFVDRSSPLVKFYEKYSDNVKISQLESSAFQHGSHHVLSNFDRIPLVDELTEYGFPKHPGLMSSYDKETLDVIANSLLNADLSGEFLPINELLHFINTSSEKSVLLWKRLYVGANGNGTKAGFETSAWNTSLIPDNGILAVGDIKSDNKIIGKSGEFDGLVVNGSSVLGDINASDSTVNVWGSLYINGEKLISGSGSLASDFLDITDDVEQEGAVFRTVSSENPHFIVRPIQSSTYVTDTSIRNALLVSRINGKKDNHVFINTPYDVTPNLNSFPYNNQLVVAGGAVFGEKDNTNTIIHTYGNSFQSHSNTTFEILHGFSPDYSLAPPSMMISSWGGLRLQAHDSLPATAKLIVGSSSKKVGMKLYGAFHFDPPLGVSASKTSSGDFSFAYVTDTGGGDETVLGTPISIRNDGYIGIGMLPENQILDVSGTNYVRSKSKILSVSGGADFINYNTDGTFSNTVTASVFENPGNPITYDEGLGIARDSGDYYGGSGTLYVKGSRYIDSDEGDEYDIVLTGNKHPYIKELAYETTGRYFGTRIDGKLHLYSQTEKIINISSESSDTTPDSLKSFNLIEFIENGSFYTPSGHIQTDEGNLVVPKGEVKLKKYTDSSGGDLTYGFDSDVNLKIKSFTLPEVELPAESNSFNEMFYGVTEFGDAIFRGLSLYGDFSFRKRSDLNLIGGNLINIHNIDGSNDSVAPSDDQNPDGDDYGGTIKNFKHIKGSGETGDQDGDYSSITNFHAIKSISSIENNSDLNEDQKFNKISGFEYIIGLNTGYIRGYKDIIGSYSIGEFNQGAVFSQGSGDIKYFRNIQGIGFDPVQPTLPVKETTSNVPDTSDGNGTVSLTKIEPNDSYWSPTYHGGDITDFQSIKGLGNERYRGGISQFKDISIDSLKATYQESYLLHPIVKLGNWNNIFYDYDYNIARDSGLAIKGGIVRDTYGVNRTSQEDVALTFFPKKVSQGGTGIEIEEDYFSFHGSDETGIKTSDWKDVKVKHIWLNGEKLTATASELNALTDNGALFTDGTNTMKGTLWLQEKLTSDTTDQDDPKSHNGTRHNLFGADYITSRKILVEGSNDSGYGHIFPDTSQNLMLGRDANLNNLLVSVYDAISRKANITPGVSEGLPADLVLNYRDSDGVIKPAVTIASDGKVQIPGLDFDLFPDSVAGGATITTSGTTLIIGASGKPSIQVLANGSTYVGGTQFDLPEDLEDIPFWKMYLDKPNKYAVAQAMNSAENIRFIGSDLELNASKQVTINGTDDPTLDFKRINSTKSRIKYDTSSSALQLGVLSTVDTDITSPVGQQISEDSYVTENLYKNISSVLRFPDADLITGYDFVEENSTNNSPASNYYTDNYDYNVVWLVYVDPNKYEFSTFSNTTTLSQEVYNTVFYDFNEKINVNDIVIHHALSAKEQELFDSTSDSDNTTFDGDYVFWKVLEKQTYDATSFSNISNTKFASYTDPNTAWRSDVGDSTNPKDKLTVIRLKVAKHLPDGTSYYLNETTSFEGGIAFIQRLSSGSVFFENTLNILGDKRVGISSETPATLSKSVGYERDPYRAKLTRLSSALYKIEFELPNSHPRSFERDLSPGDTLSVGGNDTTVLSYENIDDNSYKVSTYSDISGFSSTHEWSHSYILTARLTVDGLIKSDNVDLEGNIIGNITTTSIFLGEEGENQGYIRVSNNDMLLHTGTTSGRNLKFMTKNKDVYWYTGSNSDNLFLTFSNSGNISLQGKMDFVGDDGNVISLDNTLIGTNEIRNNLDIVNHDGSSKGLKLSGILLKSSANDLNLLSGMYGIEGTTVASKVLIAGVDRNLDYLRIDTARLGATNLWLHTGGSIGVLNSSADELNILDGVNLTLTSTEINYLDGTNPGVAVANKVLTLGSNQNVNVLRIGDLEIAENKIDLNISSVKKGIILSSLNNKPVGFGSDSLDDTYANSKSVLNLGGALSFKTTSPSLSPTSSGTGYLYADSSTEQLYYTYYSSVLSKSITVDLTSEANTWLRYLSGDNIYYKDGNVGIFPKVIPANFDLTAGDKFQLADGNLLLRKIKDPNSLSQGTPNIIFQKIHYSSPTADLDNYSLRMGFRHINADTPQHNNQSDPRSFGSTSDWLTDINTHDFYYANIWTEKEDLYIETDNNKSLILQYERGNVGIGLREPDHLLHVERDDSYDEDYLVKFRSLAGTTSNPPYTAVSFVSQNDAVMLIDQNAPLETQDSLLKILSQGTFTSTSNLIDFQITESLKDGDDDSDQTNSLVNIQYKTDSTSVSKVVEHTDTPDRIGTIAEGKVKQPDLLRLKSGNRDALIVRENKFVGIGTGYTDTEYHSNPPEGWEGKRYPKHSQITQPLTVDNHDTEGKGVKIVGKRPTLYIGSDFVPTTIQKQGNGASNNNSPTTWYEQRNSVATIVLSASHKGTHATGSGSTSAYSFNKGGKLELNYVKEYFTQATPSWNNDNTNVVTTTKTDMEYAEFRFASFADASTYNEDAYSSVEHKRSMIIAKDGVGIGQLFSRGGGLIDAIKPKHTLDVQGDLRVIAEINENDSNFPYKQYFKDDLRLGSNKDNLVMEIEDRGYKHTKGEIIIQREKPTSVANIGSTAQIHREFDSKDLGGSFTGTDKYHNGFSGKVYTYETSVKLSGYGDSFIKGGNFGIGKEPVTTQSVTDTSDLYHTERTDNALTGAYNEEGTTRLQVYHPSTKPYPVLDYDTSANPTGFGFLTKPNIDSIAKFSDDNAYLEFWNSLPQTITNITASVSAWNKILGKTNNLLLESDGHIVINTTGSTKNFEVLNYDKAIFKRTNGSLTLDTKFKWDGQNSDLELDAGLSFEGTNSNLNINNDFVWEKENIKFQVNKSGTESLHLAHSNPALGFYNGTTKIGGLRADYSTDKSTGNLSGDYWRGITIDVEDHANQGISGGNKGLARFTQQIPRTGKYGGYVTIDTDTPKLLSETAEECSYTLNDSKYPVNCFIFVSYDSNGDRTAIANSTTTTNKIYYEIDETGNNLEWKEQFSTSTDPKVIPEVGDVIKITPGSSASEQSFTISGFEKKTFTNGTKSVYEATITSDVARSVIESGWTYYKTESGTNNKYVDTPVHKLSFDKPEYAKLTVRGKVDFEDQPTFANWITLNPASNQKIYIKDQTYGVALHSVLERTRHSSNTNEEDILLSTMTPSVSHITDVKSSYASNSNDLTKLVRSDFILRTFHWDVIASSNIANNEPKERIKITDSLETSSGSTPSKIFLYENTQIGQSNSDKNLMIYGDLTLDQTATRGDFIAKSLSLKNTSGATKLSFDASATAPALLDLTGKMEISSTLKVTGNVDFNGDLDVAGSVTFNDSILEINRSQSGTTVVLDEDTVNKSGFIINRGQSSGTTPGTNDNPKPGMLWSEPDSDNNVEGHWDTSKQFVLVNDSSSWLGQTFINSRAYGNSHLADLRVNDVFAKDIYITNEDNDAYAKITASSEEINFLDGTSGNLSTAKLNTLSDIDTTQTIQSQFDVLEADKVEQDWYISSTVDHSGGKQLLVGVKGIKPVTNKPLHIRTRQNNSGDEFLAITKGTGSTEYQTTDDDRGGALQYYPSSTERMSLKGYPYKSANNTANTSFALNTEVTSDDVNNDGSNTVVGHLHNTSYDPITKKHDVPDLTLQEDWGNIGIGTNDPQYPLHINTNVQKFWTGSESNQNNSNLNVYDSSYNMILESGQPYLPSGYSNYTRPVVAFFGKTAWDKDLNQGGTNSAPVNSGSVRIRIAPRPSFAWNDTVSTERDTNMAEFEVNAWTNSNSEIVMGEEGDFNLRNYFSKSSGWLGGKINFVTSRIPAKSGNNQVVRTGISMSVGSQNRFGMVGIGTTPSNNAILTIQNRNETNPWNGTTIDVKSSIKFVNTIGGTTKETLMSMDEDGDLQFSVINSGNSDVAMSVGSSSVNLTKNLLPSLAYKKNADGTFPSAPSNKVGNGVETIRAIRIYQDGSDEVIQFDRAISDFDISEGVSIEFVHPISSSTIKGNIVKVKPASTNKVYDPSSSDGIVNLSNSVVITPTLQSSNRFELITNYECVSADDQKYFWSGSGSTATLQNRLLFDSTQYNKQGRNIDEDIKFQVQVTTDHTDLYSGATSASWNSWSTDSAYYNLGTGSRGTSGYDVYNHPDNTGEYKWRRSWSSNAGDTDDNRGDSSSGATVSGYWTKWQTNVPYDIFYEWDNNSTDYRGNFRKLGQQSTSMTSQETSSASDHYVSAEFYSNSGTTQWYSGGSEKPIWYNSSYVNGSQGSSSIADDLGVWIAFLPTDHQVNTTHEFVLQAGGKTKRSESVSIGSSNNKITEVHVNGQGSLYVGESRLQESTHGGLRIASSDLEMKEMDGSSLVSASGFGAIYVDSTDHRLHFFDQSGNDYDLIANAGGTSDYTSISAHIKPQAGSQYDNTYNVGHAGTGNYSDRLTFKDFYYSGHLKRWNGTDYTTIGETSVAPPTKHAIQVSANSNTYVVDDSDAYFTVVNSEFDSTIKESYLDVKFDYTPTNTMTDEDGDAISNPSTHFNTDPEIVKLNTSLLVPLDFSGWRDTDNKLKIKCSNASHVVVKADLYDTANTKVGNTQTLSPTTSWTEISLTEFVPNSGTPTWTKGETFNLQLTLELKQTSSVVSLSTLKLQYNTESYSTTNVPLPHISSTSGNTEVDQQLTVAGDILPSTDGDKDLGSTTKRWDNVHTNDLHLNNEGSQGNEVDGTTGNWTVQEGEEDLFIINRKTGKKFKFKLEEIE